MYIYIYICIYTYIHAYMHIYSKSSKASTLVELYAKWPPDANDKKKKRKPFEKNIASMRVPRPLYGGPPPRYSVYFSVYLLYWYKSTNTDAEGAPRRQVAAGEGGVDVGEVEEDQVAVDDEYLIDLAGISA